MNAYAQRIGWLIFWVAVVVLGLLVVPVMRNTSAIPMMVFSIIVLALASGLWGTGIIGRQRAVGIATIILILSTLSFFLPQTAKRVPEAVKSIDAWLATPSEETEVKATTQPATQPTAPEVGTREVLLLEQECLSPCSSYVGWNYKVRTDGDPIGIRYHGCSDWFDQPGKGNFPAPKCFKPGDAEFRSSDEKNLHVRVQVYRKTTVQGGR